MSTKRDNIMKMLCLVCLKQGVENEVNIDSSKTNEYDEEGVPYCPICKEDRFYCDTKSFEEEYTIEAADRVDTILSFLSDMSIEDITAFPRKEGVGWNFAFESSNDSIRYSEKAYEPMKFDSIEEARTFLEKNVNSFGDYYITNDSMGWIFRICNDEDLHLMSTKTFIEKFKDWLKK